MQRIEIVTFCQAARDVDGINLEREREREEGLKARIAESSAHSSRVGERARGGRCQSGVHGGGGGGVVARV